MFSWIRLHQLCARGFLFIMVLRSLRINNKVKKLSNYNKGKGRVKVTQDDLRDARTVSPALKPLLKFFDLALPVGADMPLIEVCQEHDGELRWVPLTQARRSGENSTASRGRGRRRGRGRSSAGAGSGAAAVEDDPGPDAGAVPAAGMAAGAPEGGDDLGPAAGAAPAAGTAAAAADAGDEPAAAEEPAGAAPASAAPDSRSSEWLVWDAAREPLTVDLHADVYQRLPTRVAQTQLWLQRHGFAHDDPALRLTVCMLKYGHACAIRAGKRDVHLAQDWDSWVDYFTPLPQFEPLSPGLPPLATGDDWLHHGGLVQARGAVLQVAEQRYELLEYLVSFVIAVFQGAKGRAVICRTNFRRQLEAVWQAQTDYHYIIAAKPHARAAELFIAWVGVTFVSTIIAFQHDSRLDQSGEDTFTALLGRPQPGLFTCLNDASEQNSLHMYVRPLTGPYNPTGLVGRRVIGSHLKESQEAHGCSMNLAIPRMSASACPEGVKNHSLTHLRGERTGRKWRSFQVREGPLTYDFQAVRAQLQHVVSEMAFLLQLPELRVGVVPRHAEVEPWLELWEQRKSYNNVIAAEVLNLA